MMIRRAISQLLLALGCLLGLAPELSAQLQIKGGTFNSLSTDGAPVGSDPSVSTPQFAGQAVTSATSYANTDASETSEIYDRYPSDKLMSGGTIDRGRAILRGSSFGGVFASGVPRYALGDEITPPVLTWVDTASSGSPVAAAPNYWRARPVAVGESFTNPGSATLVVPLTAPEVKVEASSTSSREVFVSGPHGVKPGATLLGQRVELVQSDTITLAGNADTAITWTTTVDYFPRPSYYYSPHAERVFAHQPGQVTVTWVTQDPVDADGNVDPANGAFGFREETFIVGSGTNQPVRKIYWTERGFSGPTVKIPLGRIVRANPVYNDFFPPKVGEEYQAVGSVPAGETASPNPEVRTFWFDAETSGRELKAYNREGRIFVEYLGPLKQGAGSTVHEFLGGDIVEVVQVATPTTVTVNLGEQLRPHGPTGEVPANADSLQASQPSLSLDGITYLGTSTRPDGRLVYHAEWENDNPDKITFYWTEEQDAAIHLSAEAPGLEVAWPVYLNRYNQVWPESLDDYAGVTVEDTGARVETGVRFEGGNLPTLVHQDDGLQVEAEIDTASQRLLVDFAPGGDLTNRSLIRFNDGGDVWYVRLFIQASGVLTTDPDGPGPLGVGDGAPTLADRDGDGDRDFSLEGGGSAFTIEVGQRIDPPAPGYALAGYIEAGTNYHPGAYLDPFQVGVEAAGAGAIIPVNAEPGDKMTVWWFRPVADVPDGFATFYTPTVSASYEFAWPTTADRIVLASNEGSGDLAGIDPDLAAATIYYENDADADGHNPNEEHAMVLSGRAFALRDDLNVTSGGDYTSEPFVLLSYTESSDGRPAMKVFEVLRQDPLNGMEFDYAVTAGTLVSAPMPLPLLPVPRDPETGNAYNREVASQADPAPATSAPDSYDNFTHEDRKGYHWVYRGPHDGGTPAFGMQFYYPMQTSFFIPGIGSQPAEGTTLPYLRADGESGPLNLSPEPEEGDDPRTIIYRPSWPVDAPSLQVAQTLALPKNDLPQVRGQSSVEILYQQSIAQWGDTFGSVVLHDPTRAKRVRLSDIAGLDDVPEEIATTIYQGNTYFQRLPPHLKERFYLTPVLGGELELVLEGEFVDEIAGEDYFNLNVLSAADAEALRGLTAADGDEWDSAIEALATTVSTFFETTPGTYVVDKTKDVEVDGRSLAEVWDSDTAVDSYALGSTGQGLGFVSLVFGDGEAFTPAGDPVTVAIIKVAPELHLGDLKVQLSSNPLDEQVGLRHSPDFAGKPEDYDFEWRYYTGTGVPESYDDSPGDWQLVGADLGHQIIIGGSPISPLGHPILLMQDNYFTVRYRPKVGIDHVLESGGVTPWSDWMKPQFVPGWVKRVLDGINPYNQRVTDLYNNAINTDVSVLTQAGTRWEGDIALNLENVNDAGLIEIYETVLNRVKAFTLENPNYSELPGVSDALLLAAGYLNDLYQILGNEAYADAANPTISLDGQDVVTEVNTSRFSFEGQAASLLEEELTLLRGRDDSQATSTGIAPAYNRLYWNYTNGIDAGEVIYAVNYNIKEKVGSSTADGVIDAADAYRMFPQGHGDAYGHYLTALKGYYTLLSNDKFDWQPRAESVLVLGQAVAVDYFDERKFAGAAARLADTAEQVLKLTYRQSYSDDPAAGWSHFRDDDPDRAWGVDGWASRATQGAYLNWVMGNALLPDVDEANTGVAKIDRTTVPELVQLTTTAAAFQTEVDNANARLNPLGLSPDAIAFDISPAELKAGESHFEQIYGRALSSVLNAKGAFDQAAGMTRLLRNQVNDLDDYNTVIVEQERAYRYQLIDLFGTPYPGDIGPGKTYAQGYDGPDLYNWFLVDQVTELVDLGEEETFTITRPKEVPVLELNGDPHDMAENLIDLINEPLNYEEFEMTVVPNRIAQDASKFPLFVDSGPGQRRVTGELQAALLDSRRAQMALLDAFENQKRLEGKFTAGFNLFEQLEKYHRNAITNLGDSRESVVDDLRHQMRLETSARAMELAAQSAYQYAEAVSEIMPKTIGFSNDVTAPGRGAILGFGAAVSTAFRIISSSLDGAAGQAGADVVQQQLELEQTLTNLDFDYEERQFIYELNNLLNEVDDATFEIALRAQDFQRSNERVRNVLARGDRILAEREIYRQRAASVIQGYRTNDVAFRTFRNEALEQYRTLFDLGARYTYLAAKSYDYETGLLGSPQGREVFARIVASRSLGDLTGGVPQATTSTLGDPGLAGTMAQLSADFAVAEGRLGINNPDQNGTLFSLRHELFRLLDDPNITSDDDAWQQTLEQFIVSDLRNDPDVIAMCGNVSKPDDSPVPGIVIPFGSTIQHGANWFGLPLAGGDHNYSPSNFATKIYSVGMVLDGYVGMDPYATGTPGTSGPDAGSGDSLAATPYVYLIPAGTDHMLAPPLGDTNTLRTWTVADQALPLPYNLGATDFNSGQFFEANGTLSEEPWIQRKHQAFRPVDDPAFFYSRVPQEFTSSRLIGRSVWNSQWKIVIPAYSLLNDEQEALDRFVRSVDDIKIFLRTYSNSGN